MSESNQRGGFSFQLSETPPPTRSEEQAPLADLVLDLQDFGTWEEPAVKKCATDFAPGDQATKVSAGSRRGAAPSLTEESPVTSSHPDSVAAAPAKPRIKKIQFPAKKKATSVEPQTPEKPKTRFSDSISAPAVAVRLDEGDSEPPPRMNRSEVDDELDFPDDLPSLHAAESHAADSSWGNETPSAKEIWNSARRTWKTTAQKASAFGEMSLRAGQKAARDLNGRIKEHREVAFREREARAALETSSQAATAILEDLPAAPVPRTHAAASLKVPGIKKLIAPLSAVAAAGLVYLAGTHLLSTQAAVSLNRATQAPEVPDLGSLKSQKASDDAAPAARDRRGEAAETSEDSGSEPQSDGPMKVEVAPMPDGLSWPGKGLIEVVTSEEELIYVDSVFTGRGPLRRIPVSPGEHEVSIRTGSSKRSGKVQVEVNKNTRAIFKSE